MGGRREPWAWLALLGCVVRASAFVMSGFSCFGAGHGSGGYSLITQSLTPFILSPVFRLVAVLYMVCITYLFVCVCGVLRGSWYRGIVPGGWYVPGVPCVPRVGMVGMVGRGRKGEKLGRRMRQRKKE